MINCDFLVFCNQTTASRSLFHFRPEIFLYFIYVLNKKFTAILIDGNIGVIFFKLVQIIGWWTETDSYMNGEICILEQINDTQNPGREYMNSHDSNVDSEGVKMCHWTIGLIKINTLNMRTHIYTVAINKFTFTTTVALLDTCINE